MSHRERLESRFKSWPHKHLRENDTLAREATVKMFLSSLSKGVYPEKKEFAEELILSFQNGPLFGRNLCEN